MDGAKTCLYIIIDIDSCIIPLSSFQYQLNSFVLQYVREKRTKKCFTNTLIFVIAIDSNKL